MFLELLARADDLFCFLSSLFHSHPSDLKHRFHRHHSSSSLHGSFNHNHVHDTSLPLVAEEQDEHLDNKGPVYDPKQDVFVSLFVSSLVFFLFFFSCVSSLYCVTPQGRWHPSARYDIWVMTDWDVIETLQADSTVNKFFTKAKVIN